MGRFRLNGLFGCATAIILLGGCSHGTGILPAGPNTYTAEETFFPYQGGSDAAQRAALTKGDGYCKEQGRVFAPLSMGKSGDQLNPYAPKGFAVTFKCLAPNDPAIAGYQLQPAPNIIVEQRNR